MKSGHIAVIIGVLIVVTWSAASLLSGDRSDSRPQSTTSTGAASASAETINEAKNNGESIWLLFRSATYDPCVEMQKLFEQLEPEYKGRMRFISIDVNDRSNIDLVKAWKIQYIPTTFIIDGQGNISYQNIGIVPVEDLKAELDKVVN